jgi:hypothetical protein
VAETERMPNLVVGNSDRSDSKLKNRNRFPKPNSELGPNGVHGYLHVLIETIIVVQCA